MMAGRREQLEKKRKGLLQEISRLALLIRGSCFERFSVCIRPDCSCHEGQRHGPRSYVSITVDGKQRQFYVPQDQLESVKKGIVQYHRLLEILDRITALNLELMRGRHLNEPWS